MATDSSLPPITRRQLLQAAGGITFSALLPTATGAFVPFQQAKRAGIIPPLPVFIALPYIQPGPNASNLIEGHESMVLAWQTNGVGATFGVEYGSEGNLGRKAEIHKQARFQAEPQVGDQRLNYTATLTDLSLHKRCRYRVRMNGEKLLEGYFTTRKPRGEKTRFVTFGDNSCGNISDHAIAYHAYRIRPDFVMNTGDNVYNNGLDGEYARNFFPVYNADAPGQNVGAPLLRSVPFYSVIANHDVTGRDTNRRSVMDFSRFGDSGGYYTNLHLPLNGPAPIHSTETIGNPEAIANFKACAGPRYPNMANYSYDYGDAHFLCLDSNVYVDPTEAALQAWIAKDLAATDATWKFVVYHHPAYNVGMEHYTEQHMRVLSPLLEKHGVDVVLNGHEHNYQRTRPFRFAPQNETGAKRVNSGNRLVPGTFQIDRQYDGKTHTKPNGILYITTGAGGNDLYDPQSNENPAAWLHAEDGNVDYVAQMISDRHSLTVVDMDAKSLQFTQIDEWGREIDRFRITKA